MTFAYPNYDSTLKKFIDDVYETTLMNANYPSIIENQKLKSTEQISDAIDDANLELLSAILTSYIRQERFGEGLWAQAVEDKVFLKILRRLKQLT